MKKWISFDFDGVLATYEGWKGVDVLGDPNPKAINAVQTLKNKGYKILIWTTRQATPVLKDWLKRNGVAYDAINTADHNPPDTSMKPIAHCIVDDRALRYDGQNTEDLVLQIETYVKGKED